MTDDRAGALAGITVIDLTRVLGGPYATQILGDNGAEIIKVEPPQGDEVRDWGPPFDAGRDASYFIGLNRNKRSLGLDLSRPEGRDVLLRLLEHADILIENYKPGAMEKWGLGYQAVLQPRFPKLIHCRISGFGADGPMGGFPGYDAVIQAMCGMFSINGMPESGQTRIGIPLVDIGTGLYAAIALLMALVERERSGLGQFIDMTLYDAGVALMHPHIANYVLSGKVPGLTGNAHPNISPYDKFPTRTGRRVPGDRQRPGVRPAVRRGGRARVGRRPALSHQRRSHRQPPGADRAAARPARRPGRRGFVCAAACGRGAGRPGARHGAGLGGRPYRSIAPWRPRSATTRAGACRSSFPARQARSAACRRATARRAARSWPSSASARTRSTGSPPRACWSSSEGDRAVGPGGHGP